MINVIDGAQQRKTILPLPKGLNKITKDNINLANNLLKSAEPSNSTPNGAYVINCDTVYTDSISAVNTQRWYALQITAQKKLTVYLASAADTSIDNDLLLYQLNQSTGVLSIVGQSRNKAGMYELLSYVAVPGIYFICVNAYACSAPNNFQFMATLSDIWDTAEGDDSMATAKEMPANSEITGTLDNSLDQDCRIWLVQEKGNYQLEFKVASKDLKYEVDILSSDQSPIGAVAQNTRTILTDVPAGGYYIVITSADGKIDPNIKYSFSLILLPPDIIKISQYEGMISPSGKQLVEFLKPGAIEGLERNALTVNRKEFQPQFIDFKTGRVNSDHSCSGLGQPTSQCLPSSNTSIFGVGIYHSDLVDCDNALILTISNGLYSYRIKATFSSYQAACSSRYGVPDYCSTGTDKSGMRYYSCTWTNHVNNIPIAFILDIDKININDGTLGVIDLYNPNYFYGTPDDYGLIGQGHRNFTFK